MNREPAAAAGRPANLDPLLLYRLSRLNAVAGSMVLRLCEGRFGITRREWRLIATLAGQGALGSSQLAQQTQLDRVRTSRAIGSLTDKGLVRREQAGSDRRHVRIALSERGQAIYDALYPLVTSLNEQLLDVLGEERAAFFAALSKLEARAVEVAEQADLPKAPRGRRVL
ncbi:MarR family transcriptional regulator [Pseudacidovorax intermedius]|uniref:MarR family transcriptional regulator n=1 Tax=Pseudacidovorax intermedius TaxID=433924 RepID=A0A147HBN2_9BURK|nr:MarR family transcriptional regulator [Pseudacidovorax intermedius]KTT27408.1 MarR family transcriptional regulator [Pseudacidovorax intermedius]